MPKVLSRRTFLRGSGGIAVGLPLLSAMQSRTAFAAAPKRYVQFGIPHGMYPATWYTPSGTKTLANASPVKESSFTWKPRLSFMEPHKADTLIVRGLEQWGGAGGHHEGTANTFTGGDKPANYGASLDQVIAKVLNHKPYQSLVLGCFAPGAAPGSDGMGYTQSFTGSNQPVNPDNDPKKVFETLFAGRTGGGTSPALTDAYARRKSILDLVRADFDDVRAGLGKSDKQKLTDHLEGIRSLEIDISAIPAPLDCGSLNPADFNVTQLETQGDKVMKAQIDLIAMAFSCDLTPVASLQGNFSMGSLKYPWLESLVPKISTNVNHAWTHANQDPLNPGAAPAEQPRYYLAIEQWYLEQVAYLVTRLKAQNVFDGTVVLASTSEGRGYHHADEENRGDVPYLLIGSGGGYYKTNRVVDFDRPGWIDPKVMINHTPNILTNVAKAFGYTGGIVGNGYYAGAGSSPYLTVNG